MCGICGEMSFGARPVDEQALLAVTDTLKHRGLDYGAVYRSPDGQAGLGFRRLSIIDLRAVANQPVGNEDGSIQLVFNGEIYNFQKLRKGLVANGHVIRSNSDSEVIVPLYEELGDRAIDQLDGMFALAIWDRRAGRLVLARIAPAGSRSSRMRPPSAWPSRRRQRRCSRTPTCISSYVPHPKTVYRGVQHVEPGTVVSLDRRGRQTSRRYWQLTFPAATAASTVPRADANERVRELVTKAVERRFVSDVPRGAFLSGGINSTIIVGLMSCR